jgi:hypothetical protein
MDANLSSRVTEIVKHHLEGADIERVQVAESSDQDGEPVLRVMIVFDDKNGLLDTHKTTSLARILRSKITELTDFSYPILRYVSISDARELPPEAA